MLLQAELRSVKNHAGALRKMDLKSYQEDFEILRTALEGLMLDSVAVHEKDVKALQTERQMDLETLHEVVQALKAELEGLRHDSAAWPADMKALQMEHLAGVTELKGLRHDSAALHNECFADGAGRHC